MADKTPKRPPKPKKPKPKAAWRHHRLRGRTRRESKDRRDRAHAPRPV